MKQKVKENKNKDKTNEIHKIFITSEKCQQIIGQPARNIPGIFAECSISFEMFGTSREQSANIPKENIFDGNFSKEKLLFC